ncbi:MAG: tryptophan 7-halogenase [Phycisphaeraceae bacterium]
MSATQTPPTTDPSRNAPTPPASVPDHALRVAILGGGPGGSTLATLLAERGAHVVLFDDEKRPDLIVGESLIAAIIPIFRRLGIEDEVAKIGKVKPGASFIWAGYEALHLTFASVGDRCPQYAYNVPRPAFDDLLRARARRANVHVVRQRAKVERAEEGSEVLRFAEETLRDVPALGGHQPDLVVDCTGRNRLIARMLDLPTRDGPRNDIAHFAHWQNYDTTDLPEGHVITGLMKRGWSWNIPLPDRVSVGVVMNKQHMREFGDTPEQQYLGVVADDPQLSQRTANATRLTDIVTYNNYQKFSERGYGPNWVLLGDAFGFVDPMLSPGLFLAMHAAELLDEQLEPLLRKGRLHRDASLPSPVAARPFQKALERYSRRMVDWYARWSELIEMFYSGRVLALREAGMDWVNTYPNKWSKRFSDHMEKQMACMAAGAATRSRYAWMLLRCGTRYGMRGKKPDQYEVR